MNPSPEKPGDKQADKLALINLAFELGYIIALPLVALALLGKWIDGKMGNDTQWFTLLGVILAIVLTTIWLTRRLKRYIK